VRALAVTTAKPIAAAPEIPPLNDTLPGFVSAPWQMLMAPAGTPAPIIGKLHNELVAYVASAEGHKKLLEMGLTPGAPTSPAELKKYVADEVVAWGQLVRKAGAAGIE
jgi:tripartite-type tricarboxylate transporter receptor subunit TctC